MKTIKIAPTLFLCLLAVACTTSAQVEGTPPGAPSSVYGRPTPLSFGFSVTPEQSHNPITPPERFTGLHAALDFEVSEAELTKDIPVYAVCDGTINYSGFAEGYGGLLTEFCKIDGEDVTVIYGHLTIDGLVAAGNAVKTGDQIAVLAPARSHDSDNNRKHLHLGIHKGHVTEVLGYVQTAAELEHFLDPAKVLNASPLPRGGWFMKPYWKTATGSGSGAQS